MSQHRLLERQIKRVLAVDPAHLPDIGTRLGTLARQVEADDPELARTLAGLPALFERISEGYAQFERDQTLIRRSLELSSGELTDANRLLREKSSAASQALASLSHAFDLLLEGYQDGPSAGAADNLVEISQKVLWLTQQRERISLALKHSEERFELAMRGANDGLWDWDVNNSTVYFSPRWKAMIGHAEDEVDDTPDEWSERIHPADLPGAMAAIYEYFRGSQSHYESTFRFRHKDGHYLWILSRGIAVRDTEGNVMRLVGTHSDITARVELEQHLSQFKRALDEHAIVSMSDVDGNIIYANDKFCEISQYARADLIGKNHRLLKSGLHPDSHYTDLWQTIASGRVWNGEICNRAKDGTLYWVLATIAPILDDDGLPRQYISIRADITANKLAEASLRQAKEAAEAASRAKSEFLANVSHEIRTPMNGVLGMLDLVKATPLDAEQRDYIETAHDSADALMEIINDILDLSKIEAGRLDIHSEEFSLHDLLRGCSQFFTPRCQAKRLAYETNIDPALPKRVQGDPVRLRQVLVNLLGNAVKFTQAGSVALNVQPLDQQRIEFRVRDTGIGIAADKQASIFEAFTQADGSITRKFGGTGLGLTISQRLTRLMGGELSLSSTPGRGSEFAFWLPLPAVDSTLTPSAVADSATTVQASLTILLAEDNLINQKVAISLLQKAGHRVQAVITGREAVEAIERGATVDLVLMDMQMPDMDGLEATRQIRAREAAMGARRLPIIALTANAYAADKERCLAAGMDDFLSKPLHRNDLLAAIERQRQAS